MCVCKKRDFDHFSEIIGTGGAECSACFFVVGVCAETQAYVALARGNSQLKLRRLVGQKAGCVTRYDEPAPMRSDTELFL